MEISEYIKQYFQANSATVEKSLPSLKDLAGTVVSTQTKLTVIFELLEAHITSKDNQQRSRSIKFIADLIANLPDNYLNVKEIKHLSKFLCSKLDDHYTVSTATLPGLSALLGPKSEQLISSSSDSNLCNEINEIRIDIIKSVLKDVHVQSMIQTDRYIVYGMCKLMLSSPDRIGMIKEEKFESDFVYSFIQAMDGEKDPRNLLVCFECIKLICHSLNLGPFVEETFEVFGCYFPIDFTPPKTDNFIITKQMLIDSLRECFAAKREFSKYAIPLLIEKLSSSVEEAQLDALETFAKCARTSYDPNDFREHIEQLWTLFQQMVMNATKATLEYAALDAIKAMASTVSSTVQTFDANVKTATIKVSIDSFVDKTLDSCASYLNEPDLKLVWPNVKCLQAVAAGSSTSNLLILKKVLPLLLIHYNSTSMPNQKKTYLEILWQFVSNTRKFDEKSAPPGILKENVNELLKICLTNQSNRSLRTQSLDGFLNLLSFDGLIDFAERVKLDDTDNVESNYEAIARCIWHTLWVSSNGALFQSGDDAGTAAANDDSTEVRSKIIEIYYLLVNNNKNHQTVLDWLFTSLDETLSTQNSNERPSRGLITTFEIIEKLSYLMMTNNQHSGSSISSNLRQNILKLFKKFFEVYLIDSELNAECLFVASSSLSKSISYFNELDKQMKQSDDDASNSQMVLNELINNLLNSIIYDTKLSYLLSNNESIARVSLIFKTYAQSLKQNNTAMDYLNNLKSTFFSNLGNFDPLNVASDLTQKYKLRILMQTIASLDRAAFKSFVESFFNLTNDKLIILATEQNGNQPEANQQEVQLIACQFYASMINKLEDSDFVAEKVDQLKRNLLDEIALNNQDETARMETGEESTNKSRRLRCLNLWIWVTKALVLREHSTWAFYSNKLIEWLDDPELCENSSRSFDLILNENQSVMDYKPAAIIKLFYKQRFFNSVYEKLKEKFESKDERSIKQKPFYMKSALNMIVHLPKDLIQKQIKSMLPFLLYALTVETSSQGQGGREDEQLIFSSLKSLDMFIIESGQNNNDFFISHISDIINKLLSMCKYEANLDIRLNALKCMNNMASHVTPIRLIQYQKHVCKELEPCLNDKKRVCRQMAVIARNKWFLLSTKSL